MFESAGDPVAAGQPSGSRSSQGTPSASVKSSSRGGLASVARLVKLGRCKNIVVVAGAGISTASGIPDFRLVFLSWCSLRSTAWTSSLSAVLLYLCILIDFHCKLLVDRSVT